MGRGRSVTFESTGVEMHQKLKAVQGLFGAVAVITAAGCAGGGGAGGMASPAPAATPAAAGMPAGVTPALIAEGQALYVGDALCASCHGEDGTGTGIGPDLTDATWLGIDGSFDSIVRVIVEGVAEPQAHMVPMAPMGGSDINETQARAVAAYVWSLSNG
jgi:mono/diheme cytochrome c family protein